MKFDMIVPCHDCPFRRLNGIKLKGSRIKEIAGMMLNSAGGVFPCHKSVDYDDFDEEAVYHDSTGETHCAGALIFAEKHNTATQMMRIAERLGGYDHTKLSPEAFALIWDSTKEWLANGTI